MPFESIRLPSHLLFNPDSICHTETNALPLQHLYPTATGQKGVQVPVTQHSRTWSSSDIRKKKYVPSVVADVACKRAGRRRYRLPVSRLWRCRRPIPGISIPTNDVTLVPCHVIQLRLKDSASLKHSGLCLRDVGLSVNQEWRRFSKKQKRRKYTFVFF